MKDGKKMNIIVVETLAMFGRNIGNIICFPKFLYNKCVLHKIKGKLLARPFLVIQNQINQAKESLPELFGLPRIKI